MRGRRPIVKQMAQVSIAFGAQNFGAVEALRMIRTGPDVLLCQGQTEAGPASIGIEFIPRTEQRVSAADAAVNAAFMVVPVKVME